MHGKVWMGQRDVNAGAGLLDYLGPAFSSGLSTVVNWMRKQDENKYSDLVRETDYKVGINNLISATKSLLNNTNSDSTTEVTKPSKITKPTPLTLSTVPTKPKPPKPTTYINKKQKNKTSSRANVYKKLYGGLTIYI